jgi:hypothetical protein
LRSLRPQLLAGGSLIFLNDLVRNLVQYGVLVLALDSNNASQQNASQRHHDRFLSHFFLSWQIEQLGFRPLLEHLLDALLHRLLVLVPVIAQRILGDPSPH